MGIVDGRRPHGLANLPTLLKLKRGMKPRPTRRIRDCPSPCAGAAQRTGSIPSDPVAFLCEGAHGHLVASSTNWPIAYAHTLSERHGVQRGDTVSVVMENRIEFLATIVALNKLGAVAASSSTPTCAAAR